MRRSYRELGGEETEMNGDPLRDGSEIRLRRSATLAARQEHLEPSSGDLRPSPSLYFPINLSPRAAWPRGRGRASRRCRPPNARGAAAIRKSSTGAAAAP